MIKRENNNDEVDMKKMDKKTKLELTQDELRALSAQLNKLPVWVWTDDKLKGSPLESLINKVENAGGR